MRKLSDDEVIATLEALLEEQRAVPGDRQDNPRYLALVQAVGRLKLDPDKALDAQLHLGLALAGLERSKTEDGIYRPTLMRDVAMKTRAYWPMISEALRKFGFRCANNHDPRGGLACEWPQCGCDPYALAVLDRYIKQTGTEIDPGVESVLINPPKEKTR